MVAEISVVTVTTWYDPQHYYDRYLSLSKEISVNNADDHTSHVGKLL